MVTTELMYQGTHLNSHIHLLYYNLFFHLPHQYHLDRISFLFPTIPLLFVCLLKTAIAPVIGSDTRMNADILFDEGAQRSFICSQLANKLHVVPSTTTQVALS